MCACSRALWLCRRLHPVRAGSRYVEATGLEPAFYIAETSDGVHEVTGNP